MDTWDLAILAVAGYIALTTLVRLMIRHRNQLFARFRRQMAEEKKRAKSRKDESSRDRAA